MSCFFFFEERLKFLSGFLVFVYDCFYDYCVFLCVFSGPLGIQGFEVLKFFLVFVDVGCFLALFLCFL